MSKQFFFSLCIAISLAPLLLAQPPQISYRGVFAGRLHRAWLHIQHLWNEPGTSEQPCAGISALHNTRRRFRPSHRLIPGRPSPLVLTLNANRTRQPASPAFRFRVCRAQPPLPVLRHPCPRLQQVELALRPGSLPENMRAMEAVAGC